MLIRLRSSLTTEDAKLKCLNRKQSCHIRVDAVCDAACAFLVCHIVLIRPVLRIELCPGTCNHVAHIMHSISHVCVLVCMRGLFSW